MWIFNVLKMLHVSNMCWRSLDDELSILFLIFFLFRNDRGVKWFPNERQPKHIRAILQMNVDTKEECGNINWKLSMKRAFHSLSANKMWIPGFPRLVIYVIGYNLSRTDMKNILLFSHSHVDILTAFEWAKALSSFQHPFDIKNVG